MINSLDKAKKLSKEKAEPTAPMTLITTDLSVTISLMIRLIRSKSRSYFFVWYCTIPKGLQ